jgi:hypothetical protein
MYACLPACPLSTSVAILVFLCTARIFCSFSMRPTPTLMRLPVFIHVPSSFLCRVIPSNVRAHNFSSSSASPPSQARLSAAPRSRRSCHRRPSSPPTNASQQPGSRLPLLWSSLFDALASSSRHNCLPGWVQAYLLRGNPQTRHPPRAVRRASAVGGVGWCLLSPRPRLWLCSGFLALRPT